MRIYVVTETLSSGNESEIGNIWAFSLRWQAIAFIGKRYASELARLENTVGVFGAEQSDGGWYSIVDKDGDSYECHISEAIEIDKEA